MYANVRRVYKNSLGKESFILSDLLYDYNQVTLKRNFSCGGDQGTWHDTPFYECNSLPSPIPSDLIEMIANPPTRNMSVAQAIPALFDTITESIAHSWNPSAFHVIFHSSGYDSRIISAAINRLSKNGKEWLGNTLFLSNRWEAKEFTEIMQTQGFSEFLAYTNGNAEDHFRSSLNIETAWRELNPPCPIPGNLWTYLIRYAQEQGHIPQNTLLQGYCGYWANETWNSFTRPVNDWIGNVNNWYTFNTMAMLPFAVDSMEYPLIDLNVIDILMKTNNAGGDALRQEVATFSSPKTMSIQKQSLSDCKHRISEKLRNDVLSVYNKTWYAKNVCGMSVPTTSDFSNEWSKFSLASLCEHLLQRGIKIEVK
jgi:hypothetical protein